MHGLTNLKISLPRLFNSLLTTAVVSELLAMSSNYKEVDKFYSSLAYEYVIAFWGVTPCCR